MDIMHDPNPAFRAVVDHSAAQWNSSSPASDQNASILCLPDKCDFGVIIQHEQYGRWQIGLMVWVEDSAGFARKCRKRSISLHSGRIFRKVP